MRAVRVAAWSGAPTVEDVADPASRPGRSVVRVEAAAISHVDRTIWSGKFLRHPPLPYTPGVEAAGVIEESASFSPGTRVWVRGGGLGTVEDGTWAERICAPDQAIGVLPDGVPAALGACFFSPCASAWLAVHSIGALRPGERVLVTGASGAVGSIVAQLAVEAGAAVTGTVSSPDRVERVPVGVSPVVSGVGGQAGPAALAEAGVEADLLVDTVGGPVLVDALARVSPGGRAVLIGYLAGEVLELSLPVFMQRDVALLPLNMVRRETEGRAAAPQLLGRLASGALRLAVTTFGLDATADALGWLADPRHVGRAALAVAPGPTARG